MCSEVIEGKTFGSQRHEATGAMLTRPVTVTSDTLAHSYGALVIS